MVFVGGPRQVGKTTLAKAICKANGGEYFNWDNPSPKKAILAEH
jgi:predicted AAA+ superfamily ATPase